MLRILQVSKSRVNGSLLQSIRKQHVYSEVPLPKPEKENRPLTVAIVGRPNTGKSTLFNRLTGTKMAIVSNVPGTTRDRREEKGMLAGLSLQVIDTGGLDDRGVVCEAIKQQVSEAMTSADIILFTVDARHGITPLDEHFARWIRKHLRPKGFDRNGQPLTISTGTDARASTLQDIFLVANKTEGAHLSDAVIDTVSESYRMGFGEPILISAAHGDGMADLAQVLIKAAQDRNLDDGDFYTKEKRLKLDRKALQTYIANKSGNELLDQNNQPIKKLVGGATKKMKTTGGAFANVPNAAKNKVPSGLLGNEYLDVAANAINLQNQGGEVVSGSNNLVPMTGEGTSVLPMNIALNAKGQIIRPLEERLIQLAIMGRPNVGKSTLLNSIIGSNRVITGATPGMTRDAIHVEWKFGDRNFRLVDTAGLTRMRPNKELMTGLEEKKRAKANDLQMTPEAAIKAEKKTLLTSKRGPNGTSNAITLPGIGQMDPNIDPSQFSYQISEYALISALNALRFAQVVLLVIESKQGTFNKLELQLARKCLEEGRALVICANKADMLQKDNISRDAFEASVKEHTDKFMREFGNVPIVSTSGLEGHGIRRLLDTVIATHDSWSKRVNTGLLNSWLRDMMVTSPTARLGRKRINIKYATQIKTRPPTFALFGNVTSLPGFFERFLKNRIQRDFKLEGIPVRFVVRKTVGNPVKRRLLKQGHSRRGVGHNERRGQGPTRHIKMLIQKQKGKLNVRRKRDTTKQRQRNQH